jgi:hypothetical protein
MLGGSARSRFCVETDPLFGTFAHRMTDLEFRHRLHSSVDVCFRFAGAAMHGALLSDRDCLRASLKEDAMGALMMVGVLWAW